MLLNTNKSKVKFMKQNSWKITTFNKINVQKLIYYFDDGYKYRLIVTSSG